MCFSGVLVIVILLWINTMIMKKYHKRKYLVGLLFSVLDTYSWSSWQEADSHGTEAGTENFT